MTGPGPRGPAAREPMRILLLTHNAAGIGGSYQRAWGLGRALAGRGHEVHLMAARARPGLRPRRTLEDGVRIWEAPDVFPFRIRHAGLSPLDVAGRLASSARLQVDVVHSFDHRPACSLVALAARRGGHCIWVADRADRWGFGGIAGQRNAVSRATLGRFDDYLERRIYRSAQAATAASRDLAQEVVSAGLRRERVAWIPPGANPDLIRPMGKEVARGQCAIPLAAVVMVHIGFAGYDEDLLAESFARLAAREPSAILVTSGRVGDAFRGILRSYGLQGRWRDMGVVAYRDLGGVLACADLLILPYRDRPLNRGRFPNKLGDYLASGRPVVTNPTGDMADLVREEGFGLLAEETPEAMAAAAADLLKRPELREEMGRRGRALAEGRLGWPSLAATVERLYSKVLETHGARQA